MYPGRPGAKSPSSNGPTGKPRETVISDAQAREKLAVIYKLTPRWIYGPAGFTSVLTILKFWTYCTLLSGSWLSFRLFPIFQFSIKLDLTVKVLLA